MIRRGRGDAVHGGRRRTSAELDALLDGGRSGDARLDEVLSAARAPGRPDELAAGAPAVPTPDAPTRTPSTTRRVLARLGAATLITKATIAAAGAVVVGAAAVAGATGHLPGQPRHHAPVVVPVPGGTSSGAASGPPSATPSTGTSSARSSATPSSSTTSPSGSPSPSGASAIPALCRAWLALPPGSDAVRRQPRFVVLVRAAGRRDAVTAFCRDLPTRSAGPAPSSSRSPSTGRSPSSSRTTARPTLTSASTSKTATSTRTSTSAAPAR